MNPFSNLSEENHAQILKYLRFFRQKRDGVVRTIEHEIDDIKNDRLEGDMFSKDEIEEFIYFLKTSMKNQIESELGNIINLGALTVNQLLESAQEKGCSILLETSAVENQTLLQAIDKMSLDAMPKNPKRGLGELRSFKDEAKARRDEIDQLQSTNTKLQSDINNLQEKLSQYEAVLRETAETKNQSQSNSNSRTLQLERQVTELKSDLDRKVSETPQFQQMMKLMKSQTIQLKELRTRLSRYESTDDDNDNDGSKVIHDR